MKLSLLFAAIFLMCYFEAVSSVRTYYPGARYYPRKSSSASLRKSARYVDDEQRAPSRQQSDDEPIGQPDVDEDYEEDIPAPIRRRPQYRQPSYGARYADEETPRPVYQRSRQARPSRFQADQEQDNSDAKVTVYSTSNGGSAFSGSSASSNGRNSNARGFGAAFSDPQISGFPNTKNRQDETDQYPQERSSRIFSCVLPQKNQPSFQSALWLMFCDHQRSRLNVQSRPSYSFTKAQATPKTESQVDNEPLNDNQVKPTQTKDRKIPSQTVQVRSSSLSSNRQKFNPRPSPFSSSGAKDRQIGQSQKLVELSPDHEWSHHDVPIYGNDMLYYTEGRSQPGNSNSNSDNFMDDPNEDFVILKR
ncbi:hypothetical protein HDE_06777 [Halotydeus destructor]|nr:hypothetical protein HDE_06777 [Halotydeus destructor]